MDSDGVTRAVVESVCMSCLLMIPFVGRLVVVVLSDDETGSLLVDELDADVVLRSKAEGLYVEGGLFGAALVEVFEVEKLWVSWRERLLSRQLAGGQRG